MVRIRATGVWAKEDLHVTPLPNNISLLSHASRHLLSLQCTHCLCSDLLSKGLSAPQTLLSPYLSHPLPSLSLEPVVPSLWSCPGSITAFSPSPPSALHLHILLTSKLCWPFCRHVAAPWPGTPLEDQGLVQLWLSKEAAVCPASGDTPGVWLLPTCLVPQ